MNNIVREIFIFSETGSVIDSEPFPNLKLLCAAKGLNYTTYSRKTYPVITNTFTIVKKPIPKAEAQKRVEKIPFDLVLAQKIALQHNIPEANILVWKSRGYIPSKYTTSEQ